MEKKMVQEMGDKERLERKGEEGREEARRLRDELQRVRGRNDALEKEKLRAVEMRNGNVGPRISSQLISTDSSSSLSLSTSFPSPALNSNLNSNWETKYNSLLRRFTDLQTKLNDTEQEYKIRNLTKDQEMLVQLVDWGRQREGLRDEIERLRRVVEGREMGLVVKEEPEE